MTRCDITKWACGFQAKCNEGRGPDGGRARSPHDAQSPTAGPAQRGSAEILLRARR